MLKLTAGSTAEAAMVAKRELIHKTAAGLTAEFAANTPLQALFPACADPSGKVYGPAWCCPALHRLPCQTDVQQSNTWLVENCQFIHQRIPALSPPLLCSAPTALAACVQLGSPDHVEGL